MSEMPLALVFRLREAMLGGNLPKAGETKGRTKTAQLAALGWRILPIPFFWAANDMWHDSKGNGNPASIDFRHPHEWLVIPPDSTGLPAQKITGRNRAIRWAYKRATSGRTPDLSLPGNVYPLFKRRRLLKEKSASPKNVRQVGEVLVFKPLPKPKESSSSSREQESLTDFMLRLHAAWIAAGRPWGD